MQRYSQSFRSCRSNSLAYIFLTANFAACALILDWKEFFSYIAKMDAKECKPPVSEKISFGMYHFYGSSELASFLTLLLLLFVVLILAFLFLLSLAAALSVVGGLKIDYPEWCPETFDFIFIPVFIILNSIYWVLLSYLCEWIYDFHSKHKPVRKNPLSIFKI